MNAASAHSAAANRAAVSPDGSSAGSSLHIKPDLVIHDVEMESKASDLFAHMAIAGQIGTPSSISHAYGDAYLAVLAFVSDLSTPSLDGEWKGLADRTASPNWGGENEDPIAREDWRWAKNFSERYQGAERPSPSPCGDGSVHLTWYGKNRSRLVIEHKGTKNFFSSRGAAGQYSTGELSNDEEAIERLRTFLG